MECERCKRVIAEGEARYLHGQTLCEDCYMDLLSPLKACDPWAVHSAKSLIKEQTQEVDLNPIQKKFSMCSKKSGHWSLESWRRCSL
jgi:hypothetical protein